MTREVLNGYLGELVHIYFTDGSEVMGLLEFVPSYSKKYGFRHPNFYYVGNVCFKVGSIKKIRKLDTV